MTSTWTNLTLEEFLALPDTDVSVELIEGRAEPKMSPKLFHSTVQKTLIFLLEAWSAGRGIVCPEWAVVLKRQGTDWVPVPDVTYVSFEQLGENWEGEDDTACPVPPELAIEIVSPQQADLKQKAQDYLSAGVARVWIVNPQTEAVTVYPDGLTYMGSTPIQDDLMPGLTLSAQQVFEAARRLRKRR